MAFSPFAVKFATIASGMQGKTEKKRSLSPFLALNGAKFPLLPALWSLRMAKRKEGGGRNHWSWLGRMVAQRLRPKEEPGALVRFGSDKCRAGLSQVTGEAPAPGLSALCRRGARGESPRSLGQHRLGGLAAKAKNAAVHGFAIGP